MANYPREQIAEVISRRIASGELPAGQRLPTELALAAEFGVSRGTVRKALALLTQGGKIQMVHGVGSFVSGNVRPTEKNRIIFLHTDSFISPQMLRGMESRAWQFNCELAVAGLDLHDLESVAARLRAQNIRGVIYLPFVQPDYYDKNNRLLDLFERFGLQYVGVDTPIARDGVIRGNFVGNDGYTAMRRVVRRLLELGHRNIGSVRVFAGVFSSDQRYRGMVDELTSAGIGIDPNRHRVIANEALERQGRRELREMFELADPPTVLLTSYDGLALNIYDELLQMGLRVPEDVSLCGFDDCFFMMPLGLSSVRQPFLEVGERAVECLMNPPTARFQEFLPCEFIERRSIRPYQGGRK